MCLNIPSNFSGRVLFSSFVKNLVDTLACKINLLQDNTLDKIFESTADGTVINQLELLKIL